MFWHWYLQPILHDAFWPNIVQKPGMSELAFISFIYVGKNTYTHIYFYFDLGPGSVQCQCWGYLWALWHQERRGEGQHRTGIMGGRSRAGPMWRWVTRWSADTVCVWAWSVITLRNICTGDGTAAKWEHAIKPVQNMSVTDFFFNLQVRSCWFFG